VNLNLLRITTIIAGYLFSSFVSAEQHDCAGAQFSIGIDETPFVTERDYQILVKQDGMPLARLNAPFVGPILESYVMDLSGDGHCEVVVISRESSEFQPVVHVYAWQNFHLSRLSIAPLIQIENRNETTSLMMTVSEKKLIAVAEGLYSLDETAGGSLERFVYSFAEERWVLD
jgi:hypothetical protein